MAERLICNQEVLGSNPRVGFMKHTKIKFGFMPYNWVELVDIEEFTGGLFANVKGNWGFELNQPRDFKKLSILQKELVYHEADLLGAIDWTKIDIVQYFKDLELYKEAALKAVKEYGAVVQSGLA